MTDTYYFARASGDCAYIKWLKERLIHVYGESPNVDFVQTLDAFAEAGARLKAAEDELKDLHS